MELEEGARPPMMLKEWLELESSAELSCDDDGFGCNRSGSGSRRWKNIASVSTVVRAALSLPSSRGPERQVELSTNSSRRRGLRVGFWKKRRRAEEVVDRKLPSCSASSTDASAGAAGRHSHEKEVARLEATCRLDPEREQKQRRSPVSVMDFLSQDEDDEGEEDANPGDGDGEDDEAASPTFQRSIANIRRASQRLLQTIRQFEQLADLDTSDIDDATTTTEDISNHMVETDSIEDVESVHAQRLLLDGSMSGPNHYFQKLLVDFFCEGKNLDGPDQGKLLETADAWLHGNACSLRPDRRVEMTDIEWLGCWRNIRGDEQKLLVVDLEDDIFWSLIGELVCELH